MTDRFLDKVYAVSGAEATRDLYDAWSASYDAEVSENGYATPSRCADALAQAIEDRSKPILDFGCGTGLSGLALRLSGFTTIDGIDLSAEMLSQAEAKGVYRSLRQVDADAPLTDTKDYAAITAIGVIGAGAAPLSVLDTLFNALGQSGLLCFSFNDHTLEDPAFEARVTDLVASGKARLLQREYGPHLPKLDLNSAVYVIQKT
jgi:Predicted methyltransferase (contains TPR repeat)